MSSEEQVRVLQALPTPQSCRVIDFESAQVVTLRTRPPRRVLTVSGQKPYFNMTVSLSPLVYVQQPEYWGLRWLAVYRASVCRLSPPMW